jgi:hypothetical protein
MPQNYKPKLGAKVYKNYSDDQLARAVSAVKSGMSYRKAAVKYNIPRSVINRKCKFLLSCLLMKHCANLPVGYIAQVALSQCDNFYLFFFICMNIAMYRQCNDMLV